MFKPTLLAGAAALIGAIFTPAAAQNDVTIKTTDLGDGIYMLEGQGGNIGVSVGEDGVFMIDDQFGRLADKISAAIADITNKPVEFVLNTHWHGDHTGGNEAFAGKGAMIVSHDNVRKRLKEGMSTDARNTPPAPNAALPVLTFSETATFHWNGHEIHVYHFPHAHTDGDAIVHFRDLNIMHLGDTMFSGRYPYIDLDSGGTVEGYIANLELAYELADDETQVIPGHGPLSSRADIADSIDILKKAQAAVQALVDAGKTKEEIIAADPLSEWNDSYAWRFINGDRMTAILVDDLTR